MTQLELENLFSRCGTIINSRILCDNTTGRNLTTRPPSSYRCYLHTTFWPKLQLHYQCQLNKSYIRKKDTKKERKKEKWTKWKGKKVIQIQNYEAELRRSTVLVLFVLSSSPFILHLVDYIHRSAMTSAMLMSILHSVIETLFFRWTFWFSMILFVLIAPGLMLM